MAHDNPARYAVMDAEMASDEVTDAIALIELYRQEKQKEAGLAAACGEALRKLHELLDQEKTAQQQGADTMHPFNITAVTNEIQRVRLLANAKPGPNSRRSRLQRQPQQWARPDGPRNPVRNKGRRNNGRRDDR
jgi:hypothetical protein